MTIYSEMHKIPQQKIIDKFEQIWPGFTQRDFWDRLKCDGYISLPKTFPLICVYMDCLEKGGPISPAYLSLWANTFDLPCVEIRDEALMAMESGFSGQRPVDTWKKRMQSLERWGFIESRGGLRDFQFVLLPNPHLVVKIIHEAGKVAYEKERRESIYRILVSKDIDVKGKGFRTLKEIQDHEMQIFSRRAGRKP
jgi:hypothetical protein